MSTKSGTYRYGLGRLRSLTRSEHPGATISRPSARAAVVIRRTALVITLILAGLLASPGLHARPFRVYAAAQSATFNLVAWEVQHVAEHLGVIWNGLRQAPETDSTDIDLIRSYLLQPRAARESLRWEAERALERQLSALIASPESAIRPPLDVPVPGLLPPVAFRFTSAPSVLIVAPRDRLVVEQSVFLQPALQSDEIRDVEERVDSLGVSSLVTPIGGLATYPAMVVESGRPGDILAAVAHEWAHAYLIFRPIGAGYWSNQEGRAINETVADLVGRELGAGMAQRIGVPPPTEPSRGGGDRVFLSEMRQTRQEVERLLANGAVDEAEAYMERRRGDLESLGYRVRRLNQAYLAFHGSYAESSAGDDRIGRLVRGVRSASPSLGSFLDAVGNVQSVDELERLASSYLAASCSIGSGSYANTRRCRCATL